MLTDIIQAADGMLRVDPPSLDTNGAFLTEEARQCVTVGSFELGGSFNYYTILDPDHLDSLHLRVKASRHMICQSI